MHSQSKMWYGSKDAKTNTQYKVQCEEARQSALIAEAPCLIENKYKQDNNDEDQGCNSTRLLAYIVRSQPLDGYAFKRVVSQRADPCAADPQDGLFDLSLAVAQGYADAKAIQEGSSQRGRQEAAKCRRGQGRVVRVWGRIRGHCGLEEQYGKDRGKEGGRARGE